MREIKFNYIVKCITDEGIEEIKHFIFKLGDLEGEDYIYDLIRGRLDEIWFKEYSEIEILARRQYTGLKDKEGKEIYEGDIITIKHSKCGGYTGNYVVEYEEGKYGIRTEKGKKLSTLSLYLDSIWNNGDLPENLIEIIGNIIENPNLLNKE